MIDLHSHTTASDGTSTPLQLVDEARAVGLEILAVTDHDTFAGADICLQAALNATESEAPLHVIPGVEISTSLDAAAHSMFRGKLRDIHLLAFFPRQRVPDAFRHWVLQLEESRWERNRELLATLAGHGIQVEEAELRARGGSVAGRVHLSHILLERGVVASLEESFERYLGESAASYVPRQSPPISTAIAEIRKAGGLSSLAHPIRFWGDDWESGDQLALWLAEVGLDAIEVWHSEQSSAYSSRVLATAQAAGLRVTGGSDYHGRNKPGIALAYGHGQKPLVPVEELRAFWEGAPLSLFDVTRGLAAATADEALASTGEGRSV